MQQHPIPQNITGFEFKLVGFLTLKQFLYLAGVSIISFIIFVSIASFVKWVFIVPLVTLGLALAFFPINGMTFDKWLVIFIRAVTSPSRRVWQKEKKILSFLEPRFSYYLRRPAAGIPVKNVGRNRLDSYLAQVRRKKQPNKLDALEQTRLSALGFNKTPEAVEVITADTTIGAKTSSIAKSTSELAGISEEGTQNG